MSKRQGVALRVGANRSRTRADVVLEEALDDRAREQAIAPLAAITVERGRLTRIGAGGTVHDIPVIELCSNAGLRFPIPIRVAAEVAGRILEIVPKNKALHSMFNGKESEKKKPRASKKRKPDVSGGEEPACE